MSEPVPALTFDPWYMVMRWYDDGSWEAYWTYEALEQQPWYDCLIDASET